MFPLLLGEFGPYPLSQGNAEPCPEAVADGEGLVQRLSIENRGNQSELSEPRRVHVENTLGVTHDRLIGENVIKMQINANWEGEKSHG